jgi:hypothetical protein
VSGGGGGSGSGGSGGTAGSPMVAAGGVSTNDSPACLPKLSSCDVTNDCCAGAVCADGRCRDTCADDAECSTGCCEIDPTVGHKICSAVEICEAARCQAEATACAPDATCCGGLVCIDDGAASTCRQACATDGDCDSNCCIPAGDAGSGYCTDALVCSCVGEGETCSGSILCCEGFACSTFDSSGAFRCQKRCADDTDCGTGDCCRTIQGTSNRVCLSGSYCI